MYGMILCAEGEMGCLDYKQSVSTNCQSGDPCGYRQHAIESYGHSLGIHSRM